MKKILALGLLACLSTSAIASLNINNSLVQRCHEAAVKIEAVSKLQTTETCKDSTTDLFFEYAGKSLVSDDKTSAKMFLTEAKNNLKYAQQIGCTGQDTISWSINEAESIRSAIK